MSKSIQTLFDTTEDLNLSSYEGQIFNGNTFRRPFTKELEGSECSIVIASPKLYHVERNLIVKEQISFQTNGVEVAILTATDNE